jgi:hypothetical protein
MGEFQKRDFDPQSGRAGKSYPKMKNFTEFPALGVVPRIAEVKGR